jgi:nucleoside phosphorylase
METSTIALQGLIPRPTVSFLIVTAVDVERDAILETMNPLAGRDRILKVPNKESTYFLGTIGKYTCALVLGEAGSDTRKGSALEVQAGIDTWSPLAVIAPGIAFGRRMRGRRATNQVRGDVLVSTQVYPYHHAKLTPRGQEDRGPHPEASIVLRDRISNLLWTWTAADGQRRKPLLGPILSGPYVLNDAAARDELFERYPRAIGGEMEGTGVYSASDRGGTQWIVIKGVCDWGAGKGDSHQAFAARNAAKLVLAVLSEDGLDAPAFGRAEPSTQSSLGGWHPIEFSEQSDLSAALSEASLGPAHVKACPAIREVEDIMVALEDTGGVAVVGPSGSGKSMAAWHAAFRLHESGWRVYVLAQPLSSSGLPDPNSKALLVVDDAQAFAAPPIAASLVTSSRRVLVISTEAVAGFRRTVRIIPERAVAALAEGLISRRATLTPLLRKLDRRVGDGSFDLSLELKIESAKRASHLPWQFMFNLGSGQLRLDRALKALATAPPRDTVLFAIAAGQLATMDRGAEAAWLLALLLRHGVEPEPWPETLAEIDACLSLVRIGTRITTPHSEVAGRIINEMYFGLAGKVRRAIYWELFDYPSIPLGGVAWLAGRSPSHGSDAPEGLVDRLLQRCNQTVDHGRAGFVLATLLSGWRVETSRLQFLIHQISEWVSEGAPEHAWGLSRLVNEINNADRSDHHKAGGSPAELCVGLGAELASAISVARVAAWVNTLTLEDDGGQASLLERLAVVASPKFRKELGALIDEAHLASIVRAARPEQLGPAADLIVAVHPFNTLLARQLVREAMPAIVAAMRVSVPNAYGSAHDVFWRVLGFISHFLKEGPDPDSEQRDLTSAIFEGVGADSLADQLSNAERRDWNPWQSVSALLRRSAPELASAVGKRVDLSRIAPHLTEAIESSMYDVDCLLSALLLSEGNEPAATLVREVLSPQRKMNWRAALIAPESAVEVITAGVTFSMELGGGLPRWDVALGLLSQVGVLNAEAARSLFLANVAEFADGLLYRQANGGEGALSFVNTAMEFDRDVVLDGFNGSMLRQLVDAGGIAYRARAKN